MNILVTGAGGFLGSGLVTELKKQGHHVRALIRRKEAVSNLHKLEIEVFICDILDKESLKEAVKGMDVIFHTAAIYEAYPFYWRKPRNIYDTNIEGTRNVFEAACAEGIKKVIYTSSTAAVGKCLNGQPANESVALNLFHKRSHYEKSKHLAEKIAFSYCSKGIHVVSINPSFLFGVRDSRPTLTGEVVVKFLNRVYPCYFDAPICVASLDTTIEAHIKAMERGMNGERYIVVEPHCFTVKEIFNKLESLTGIKYPRIKMPLSAMYLFSILNEAVLGILGLAKFFRPIIKSEMVRYFMLGAVYDGSKAREEFGLSDKPFEETLKSEVEWYMRNGYIRRSSRVRYYKNIGKFRSRKKLFNLREIV